MILPYKISALRGRRVEWCCQVEDVRPVKGDGWDIVGPFVSVKGTAEEGSLFCVKSWTVERRDCTKSSRHCIYAVYRVIGTVRDSVECLAMEESDGYFDAGSYNVEAMYEEFPALRAVGDKGKWGMVRVEYVLLRELRQRASSLAEMARLNEIAQREQIVRENMDRYYGELVTQRMVDDMMTRYPMWGFDPVTGVGRRMPPERVVIEKKPVETNPEKSLRDYEPGKRKMRG